jgi:hypothetical protein
VEDRLEAFICDTGSNHNGAWLAVERTDKKNERGKYIFKVSANETQIALLLRALYRAEALRSELNGPTDAEYRQLEKIRKALNDAILFTRTFASEFRKRPMPAARGRS